MSGYGRSGLFRLVRANGFKLALCSLIGIGLTHSVSAQNIPFAVPMHWPEAQRAFLQDGPGLLLSSAELAAFLAQDDAARSAFVDAFLRRDPRPETPENELEQGIARRRALVLSQDLSFQDDRAKLLFLHGRPQSRRVVECQDVFNHLEIWRYPDGRETRTLLLYRPPSQQVYRLWRPGDTKQVLYTEKFLTQPQEQREENGRDVVIHRLPKWLDLYACESAREVDQATGSRGAREPAPLEPEAAITAFLHPPRDLGEWSAAAAATLSLVTDSLGEGTLELDFLPSQGQQQLTRMRVTLHPSGNLTPFSDQGQEMLWFKVEARFEQEGGIFAEYQQRFELPVPAPAEPVVLVTERALQPGKEVLVQLKVIDQVSQRKLHLRRGFLVPASSAESPPQIATAADLAMSGRMTSGRGGLALQRYRTDPALGSFRADARIGDPRIRKVVFYLDGKPHLTRQRPPFTVDFRLEAYPTRHIVGALGFDAAGQQIAADEIVVNPRQDPPPTAGLIELHVAATDASGQLIPDLGVDDFRVLEDGKEQAIVQFDPANNLPLAIGLAVDSSAAMSYFWPKVEPVIGAFLTNTLTPRDRGFALAVADEPLLITEPTANGEAIVAKLNQLQPHGRSAWLDAVATSLYYFRGVPGQRALVVLAASADQVSRMEWRDLYFTVRRDQVAIYAIGLDLNRRGNWLGGFVTSSTTYSPRGSKTTVTEPPPTDPARREIWEMLETLAELTGGRAFHVDSAAELPKILSQIATDLRGKYRLVYQPPPPSSETAAEYRKIDVKIRRSNLLARTARRGYFP